MKRSLSAFFALCILGGAGLAQTPDPRTDELAKIEKRLKDRAAEERRLKDEAKSKEKEIAALRFRLIETASALQESEGRLIEIGAEIERLTVESFDLSGRLTAQQSNLSDVLAALQSLEISRPPALLVSPRDANRAASVSILLADAAPVLEAKARALRENIGRLAALKEGLDRERAKFEKAKGDVESRRIELAGLLKKKQTERDVAASLAAAAQKETAALALRATTLREVIRRLERLARTITPRLKPPAPSEAAPPRPRPAPSEPKGEQFEPAKPFVQARGALRPPVVGRIVGRFGSPDAGGPLDGMRIAAPDNALVTAPYEAKVAIARAWDPIGNLIVLDVGGGYHMLLLGFSMFLAEEGQVVAAGEPVASMAAPAGAREANLYLEIRKNGEPVNPSLWLSRKSVEEMGY
ncbi:MAG: peptidoglycan DD-metalloendopeptidase family protein [Parvularculaceae bacterium]